MACPQDMRIWISELEGFIKSPSSSSSLGRNEVEDRFSSEVIDEIRRIRSSLRNEDEGENELLRNPCVFEATQITKEEDELGCFKPSFLTIGPLHFDPCNPAYDKGNALKMEALRFLMKSDNLGVADRDAPPWQLQDGQEWIGVFNGIVNKIAGKEARIRRCYREGRRRIPSFLVDRDLGWMILVDACFILVSLYIFQSKAVKEIINNNKNDWPCLHFLTRGAEDATLRMILRDMVLLENQLPSWLLKEVAHMLHIKYFDSQIYDSGHRELVSLMLGKRLFSHLRLGIANEVVHVPYNVRSGFIVLARTFKRSLPSEQRRRLIMEIFLGFRALFQQGFESLADDIEDIWKRNDMQAILFLVIRLILIILLLILVILLPTVFMIISMVMIIVLIPSFIIAYFWPNPILTSEGRLRPQGFLPYFLDEEISNLILRNIIALERSSPYMRKTVSNYVFLMGEILETHQDVEALQAIGLVPKTVNSEREVQRWKSLAASAKVHGRSYADFDDPISVYRRELLSCKEPSKLRMMWWTWKLWVVDLKKAYASSPWIALSTFAAIALLFMTGAQVVCLFISCNEP